VTAEVGVINTRGVALAADSAVTIGEGAKVYNTSSKIARLSDVEPVGIMTYGNAGFVGLNWDLVFSEYRRMHGGKKLDTLSDYAMDFLKFLATEERIFSVKAKKEWLDTRIHVHLTAVMGDFAATMRRNEQTGGDEAAVARQADTFVAGAAAPRRTDSLHLLGTRCFSDLEEEMSDSVASVVRTFLDNNPEVLNWPGVTRERMVSIGTNALMGDTRFDSGLVVAGYGCLDTFPALVEVRPIYAAEGAVLYSLGMSDVLDHDNDTGWIYPFAQSEVVDAFIRGIDGRHYLSGDYTFDIDGEFDTVNIPGMTSELLHMAVASVLDDACPTLGDAETERLALRAGGVIKDLMDRYWEKLRYAQQQYSMPVIAAVDALTKEGLAEIAEELINLTSLRRKFAIGVESVGGPVDVAVITRSDGFVWVKRKQYYDSQLNPHLAAYHEARREP